MYEVRGLYKALVTGWEIYKQEVISRRTKILKFYINKTFKKLMGFKWWFNRYLKRPMKCILHLELQLHIQEQLRLSLLFLFLVSQMCVFPITLFFSICSPAYWPLAPLWFFIAPHYIFSKNKTSVTEVTIWLFKQSYTCEMLARSENMYHGKKLKLQWET